MTSSPTLLWYRNDLRVHDHEPLQAALTASAEAPVIAVYCLDPRQFATTAFGFAKTGAFRAQFLLQALAALRSTWQHLGSNLVIRYGQPEQVLPQLCQQVNASTVVYHHEVTQEELTVATALEQALATIGVSLQGYWGHTLYHPDDLPVAIADSLDQFTHFRKAVEKAVIPRPSLPSPTWLRPLPQIDPGQIPTLEDLGLQPVIPDDRAVMPFVGGEPAGQQRVQEYVWDRDRLRCYKETRNGMVGADYSSKFSPWLALGCLSPRYLYEQVRAYERLRLRNDSTYWLIFELLWRDYFRFICAHYDNQVFQPSGLRGILIPWQQDWPCFDRWREGTTGFPLIDANMRELATTGFMSNRGRQNVASFLTKNLGIDWRMGAEWFESLLIDYDVCSNWGNWTYAAGVGTDGRGFRFFNPLKQAKDYDPEGIYVKHWLPELSALPASRVHEPWMLSPSEQKRFGLHLGIDYPLPIVDLFASAAANQQRYNSAIVPK